MMASTLSHQGPYPEALTTLIHHCPPAPALRCPGVHGVAQASLGPQPAETWPGLALGGTAPSTACLPPSGPRMESFSGPRCVGQVCGTDVSGADLGGSALHMAVPPLGCPRP